MAHATTYSSISAGSLMLLACATHSPSGPPAPPPAAQRSVQACGEDAAKTASHCECLGGYVRGGIGDGKIACPQGETELERLQQGSEGAVCCKGSVQ